MEQQPNGWADCSSSSVNGGFLHCPNFQLPLQPCRPSQSPLLDSIGAMNGGDLMEPTPIGPKQGIQVVRQTTLADTDGLRSLIKKRPRLLQDNDDSLLECFIPRPFGTVPGQSNLAVPGVPDSALAPAVDPRALENLWQLMQEGPSQLRRQENPVETSASLKQRRVDNAMPSAMSPQILDKLWHAYDGDQAMRQHESYGLSASVEHPRLSDHAFPPSIGAYTMENVWDSTQSNSPSRQQLQQQEPFGDTSIARQEQHLGAMSNMSQQPVAPAVNSMALEELWQQTRRLLQQGHGRGEAYASLSSGGSHEAIEAFSASFSSYSPLTDGNKSQSASIPSVLVGDEKDDQVASGTVDGPIEVSSSSIEVNSTPTSPSSLCTKAPPCASSTSTVKETGGEIRFRASHLEQWNQRFNELVQFRLQNGNCLVPVEYAPNPRLSYWVKRQRGQYKLLKEGKHSTLTPDRKKALDDLGFVWESHLASWLEKFEELVRFRSTHGHCNVSKNDDYQLSIWVKCQKRQLKLYHSEAAAAAVASVTKHHNSSKAAAQKKSNLTSDLVEKLMAIGLLARTSGRS